MSGTEQWEERWTGDNSGERRREKSQRQEAECKQVANGQTWLRETQHSNSHIRAGSEERAARLSRPVLLSLMV